MVKIKKIKEIWEQRAREEPPEDVVFGRLQGTRLKEILKESEAREHVKNANEEIAKELRVEGKRIIDAGVGPLARFSSLFSELGAEVIGVDLSRAVLESAKTALNGRRVDLTLADIMNLPFKEESFDISFCVGTIFHLPGGQQGVEKALKELARITKQDGIIYFNVENYLNPMSWTQIFGRKILTLLGANMPHHTFFNYFSLLKIIERCGLRVIEVKTTFELWGPLLFLPTPILMGIFKIWQPVSERISKISNKNGFLRFVGVGWYLRVKKME